MKWIALVAAVVLCCAGVAQATGVLESNPPAEHKERAIVERAINLAEGEIEAKAARVRGPRGPRGARGPRGPRGFQGPTGATGPKGTFGAITSYASAPVFLCGWEAGACSVGSQTALCPPGTTPIAGGHSGAGIRVFSSTPIPGGWYIGATNEDYAATTFRAYVVCASP